MSARLICGLIVLSLASLAATPASAVAYEFQLSGSRSAIFSIDQSRAPDNYTATQTFFDATPGTYSGVESTADISFSTNQFGGTTGGFEAINLSLLGFSQFISSEVLFTGSTAHPVFKTGFFDLNSIVAGSSTLLITEADGMPSTIPEPATWAMLITGMGFAGGVIRRRRAMAAAD